MRKIKVLDWMFFEAGFSFSLPRMYYEHVLALFDQSTKKAQEFRKQVQAEYESKGREYDTQTMRDFHRVYDEVYPNYFHNSFLVTACTLFEHQVKKLWAFIQKEYQVPFVWDDFKGPVPTRMKRLLNFAGVVLQDDPPILRVELPPPDFKPTPVYNGNRVIISTLWKELGYYYRVRNCIIHDNNLVEKAMGSSTLQRYAIERRIVVEIDGKSEIQLNKDFNLAVCETMRVFFNKLMDAYLRTPLPE
jgi:hypothetical protein